LAATATGHIGVIGTLATVRSGSYERAITERDPGSVVTTLACPILVPLAEEGWTDDEVAAAVARRYLGALFARDREIDTLVLGCTHYPLLTNVLARTARDLASRAVRVVDSATAMADAAERTLGSTRPGETRGALHCYVTDASRLDELGPRFLGEALSGFELVDL
jgi:glutamate racemase